MDERRGGGGGGSHHRHHHHHYYHCRRRRRFRRLRLPTSLPYSIRTVAATISYVRGDTMCRRRTPLYRGYSRANLATRRNMRVSRGSLPRGRRPVAWWYEPSSAARSSSVVRNVHTQIYLCVFLLFLFFWRENTCFSFFAPQPRGKRCKRETNVNIVRRMFTNNIVVRSANE